ncbi:MAG: glycosyltransferase family 4 protein [Myxococcales bacterium]|nr:glycosyltransferase family 4 protein [Myxococcales bacterium]
MGLPVTLLTERGQVRERDVPDADALVTPSIRVAGWLRNLPLRKGSKILFVDHGPLEVDADLLATADLPFHLVTTRRTVFEKAVRAQPNETVRLIPGGLDPTAFLSPRRDRGEPGTVGYRYRASDLAGLETALQVFRRLQGERSDIRMLILSTDPRPGVRFPPGVSFRRAPSPEERKENYATCDAWIEVAGSDQPHAYALEACAARCPLVSARRGGVEEFVEPGVNGYLADDAQGLADALLRILTVEEGRWQRLAEGAQQTALRNTADDAAKHLADAFRHAVESERFQFSWGSGPEELPQSRDEVLDQVALIGSNYGNGIVMEEVLDDWFNFMGGKPSRVAIVDNGSPRHTQYTLFDLARRGLVDRVCLSSPKTYDIGKHQSYIADHLSAALGNKPYLMWFHFDTLPYRRGNPEWIVEAVKLLERKDTFSVSGSYNMPSKHHEAWNGWFYSHKCSQNFALMKQEMFAHSVEAFEGDFVRSGYYEPCPEKNPLAERFLSEVVCETYMRDRGMYSLSRKESLDWSIGHTNVFDEKLRNIRPNYLRRTDVRPYLNLGDRYSYGKDYLYERYYGQGLGPSTVKRLRMRVGASPLARLYRRAVTHLPPHLLDVGIPVRDRARSNSEHDRASLVVLADAPLPMVREVIGAAAAQLGGRPRQILLYADAVGPSAQPSLDTLFAGLIDKLFLIRDLPTDIEHQGWWVETAALTAALEPEIFVVKTSRPQELIRLSKGDLTTKMEASIGGWFLSGYPRIDAAVAHELVMKAPPGRAA